MPGSLGIEAMLQAIKIYSQQQSKSISSTYLASGQKMSWSYRGQVLQQHKEMQLEVRIHKMNKHVNPRIISGDASLWADNSRIYEVRNIALAIED